MKPFLRLGTIVLTMWAGCTALKAAAPANSTSLAEQVPSDVVGIAYIDVPQWSQSNLGRLLGGKGDLPFLPPGTGKAASATVTQVFQQLSDAGVIRVYALLRVADIEQGTPIWIFAGHDGQVTSMSHSMQALLARLSGIPVPRHFQAHGSLLIGGANESHLAQYEAALARGTTDADLTSLLQETDGAIAGLLVIGDRDSRRVVRETFPRLPTPFAAIDGKRMADDLAWGHLAVFRREKTRIELSIQAHQPAAAHAVNEAAQAGNLLFAKAMASVAASPEAAALPPDLIQSSVVDNRVTVRLIQTEAAQAFVAHLLGQQMNAKYRAEQINQARQLALAMINYESAFGFILPHASYNAEGRPLLSWRVHLLPYLEQQKLYEEFHLDEPWDSAHNRRLIDRMPEVFGERDPRARAARLTGRTRWLVPVGKETTFPTRDALPSGEPLRIRDMKDGTSRTVVLVHSLPDRAVVWTKPEDWQVDFAKPLEGVVSAEQDAFVTGRGDGSVEVISAKEMTAEAWRAMLTRAAGD